MDLEEEVEVNFYKLPLYKLPGFREGDDDKDGILAARDVAVFFELGIITEEEAPVLKAVEEVPEEKADPAN